MAFLVKNPVIITFTCTHKHTPLLTSLSFVMEQGSKEELEKCDGKDITAVVTLLHTVMMVR